MSQLVNLRPFTDLSSDELNRFQTLETIAHLSLFAERQQRVSQKHEFLQVRKRSTQFRDLRPVRDVIVVELEVDDAREDRVVGEIHRFVLVLA